MEIQIKERIINQSLILFKKDSTNVSVSDICKACNISRPTFYKYFKNKDILFKYFYEYMGDIIEKDMVKMVYEETLVEQIWFIFDRYISYVEDYGADFMSNLIIANLREDIFTFEIIKNLWDVAANLISKAYKEGQIRNSSDPRDLYVVLCRYYDGCVQYWCGHHGKTDIRKEIRKGFEHILDLAPQYRTY